MNYRLWIWWLTWMTTLSYLLIGVSIFGQFVVLVSIFTSNFSRKIFFCYDMLGDDYFWLNFFTNWKWKFIQLKWKFVCFVRYIVVHHCGHRKTLLILYHYIFADTSTNFIETMHQGWCYALKILIFVFL